MFAALCDDDRVGGQLHELKNRNGPLSIKKSSSYICFQSVDLTGSKMLIQRPSISRNYRP